MKLFKQLIAIVAMSIASQVGHAVAFSNHYVFGDSLSDVGNLYLATGGLVPAAPGYAGGRFSNGPIYVDYLNASLGLAAPTPSLAGGNVYAVGGARTSGNAFSDVDPAFNTFSFNNQIAAFTATHGSADPNALYTVFQGPNDVFAALMMAPADAQAYLTATIMDIAQGVGQLLALGARNVLIANVPDLGLTPRVDAADAPLVSAITASFNAGLAQAIWQLDAAVPDANIVQFDTFSAIRSLAQNPAAYGLVNVTQPCFSGYVDNPNAPACSNPDEYLFWDIIHPTSATHAALAGLMLQQLQVPEPASLALVLLALFAFAHQHRARNRR